MRLTHNDQDDGTAVINITFPNPWKVSFWPYRGDTHRAKKSLGDRLRKQLGAAAAGPGILSTS